jgi:hypothetical protein
LSKAALCSTLAVEGVLMKKLIFGFPLVVAITVSAMVGACGDSDEPGDGDGDTTTGGSTTGDGDETGGNGGDPGDGDGDASGGTSATGGTDGGDPNNIPCEAAGETAVCVNATDCPFVEDGTLRSQAKDCLLNDCIAAEDQESCVADCLEDTISTTADCSACYGASASCSFENCFADCAADGDAPACRSCQAENGCLEDFFTCSGLAVPE